MQGSLTATLARRAGIGAMAGMLLLGGRAYAGCKDVYPDADVIARLAKTEYAGCSFAVMKADYAGILEEQSRLLSLLRPAYERNLEGSFGQEQRQLRVKQYDSKLASLLEIAGALKSDSGEDAPAPYLLRESKQLSRGLRSRILVARNTLENGESVAYCKLDFYFRLRAGLQRMLRQCSHGGGG